MSYKTKNKLKDEATTLIRVYKKTAKNLVKKAVEKGITVADLIEEKYK